MNAAAFGATVSETIVFRRPIFEHLCDYRGVQEFPAFVKHGGVMPRRPTEVHRADAPLAWRVIQVLHTEVNVVVAARSARRVYRLKVFGALPYAPERSGAFVLVAVDYSDRPYWWISLP